MMMMMRVMVIADDSPRLCDNLNLMMMMMLVLFSIFYFC